MAKTMGTSCRALCIVRTRCGTQEARLFVRETKGEKPEYFWSGRYLQRYSLDPFATDSIAAKSSEQAVQRFQELLSPGKVFPHRKSPSDLVSTTLVQLFPRPYGSHLSVPFPGPIVDTRYANPEALAA